VLLTTITTMAGLAPMMFGLSVDFIAGGYSLNAPSSLWWKQLATAVVFGLGVATILTLVLTPALLAIRVWAGEGAYAAIGFLRARAGGPDSAVARDRALARALRETPGADLDWSELGPPPRPVLAPPARAAE
jgi:multidrug efflux pump